MSGQADLQEMRAAITARPEPQNLKLDMPVENSISEAGELLVAATEDKAKLVGAGFNWAIMEKFPQLIGALSQLQSLWKDSRFNSAQAQVIWDQKYPVADEMRGETMHAMTYAFRNSPELLAKLARINEGHDEADFVQDLSDIVVTGREEEAKLNAIKFPMVQIDSMADFAEEMRLLLAAKNGALDLNEYKLLRDKALVWVKEIVSELYSCGQYVFWKDEKRKKKYRSEYLSAMYRRNYLKSKAEQGSVK